MKKVQNFLYEKETYLIRKACFTVWNELGSWHKEKILDKALTVELRSLGLQTSDQRSYPISYKGKFLGFYRPDKIVNNRIIVEIKSKPKLNQKDIIQFWRYLKTTNLKLGLLVNFGLKLEIIRRVYDTARMNSR